MGAHLGSKFCNFWRGPNVLFKDTIFRYLSNINLASSIIPVDTGRKLNVDKTFRRRLLNVLCTFNLRPVSTGMLRCFWDDG